MGPLPEQRVRSYTRVDSQLTWRLSEGNSVEYSGAKPLSDHHLEFNSDIGIVNPSQIKRSTYAKMTWKF